MTDDITEGQKQESKPFVVPESTGEAMSIGRAREIARADREGTPLDVSPEERREYEEVTAKIRATMQGMSDPISKMMQGLGAGAITAIGAKNFHTLNRSLTNKTLDNLTASMEESGRRLQEITRPNALSLPALGQDFEATLDSIAKAKEVKAEAQELRDDHMRQQTEALQLLAGQSAGQGRINWALLIIGALTLLATIAGVVVTLVKS